MLKVNVGLSRKLSRDYNSTGYSVNLEGEVCVAMDDPEAVIEKIREYYDLADEALRIQIERYEGDSAIASRDEERQLQQEPAPVQPTQPQRFNYPAKSSNVHANSNANQEPSGGVAPATNKQIQFLLNLSKRHGMTTPQLQNRIAGILGQAIDVYSLSKQQAGVILDNLSGSGNSRPQQN